MYIKVHLTVFSCNLLKYSLNKFSGCTLNVDSVLRVRYQIGDGMSMYLSVGGNPHLTNRFCWVVLCPNTISKMVSESIQDS